MAPTRFSPAITSKRRRQMSAPAAMIIFLIMELISIVTLMGVTRLDGWM